MAMVAVASTNENGDDHVVIAVSDVAPWPIIALG